MDWQEIVSFAARWEGKVTLTLSKNDLEMILNALSYEHTNNSHLSQEYRDALEALAEALDKLSIDLLQ